MVYVFILVVIFIWSLLLMFYFKRLKSNYDYCIKITTNSHVILNKKHLPLNFISIILKQEISQDLKYSQFAPPLTHNLNADTINKCIFYVLVIYHSRLPSNIYFYKLTYNPYIFQR